MEKSGSEQRGDQTNTSVSLTAPEEIAWQMVNNVFSQIANRLTMAGLELAAIAFVLGTLMASSTTVAVEDPNAGVAGILPKEGGFSGQHIILWLLICVTVVLWHVAFLILLRVAWRLMVLEIEVGNKLNALLKMKTSEKRVDYMMNDIYYHARKGLVTPSRSARRILPFIICGMLLALVAIGVWAYITVTSPPTVIY